MNPSILGKTNQLDAASAHFVTAFSWHSREWPFLIRKNLDNISTKKKAAQRAAYKEAREGGKFSGKAMQDDERQAFAGTLESEKSNIQEEG